jgi:holo-[acyl-carrier protein] synthase
MILGSGIDLIEIARIQQSMDRYGQRFLDRVFTAGERAYCLRKRKSAESFAARFAAKEAAAKALGTGISYGVNWLEIEVVRQPGERPNIQFHGRAAAMADRLGVVHAALSITHTVDLAMASVVLEGLTIENRG